MSSVKKQPLRIGSMIGEIFPFFLNNKERMSSYYLYQVGSPEMTSEYIPLLTMAKVGERTQKPEFQATLDNMYDCDIIAHLLRSRKGIETKAVEFLEKDILSYSLDSKDPGKRRKVMDRESIVYSNGSTGFPLFEYDRIGNITRTIIVGLRDNLRWGWYRFFVGNMIDMLTARGQHSMFKIIETGKNESGFEYLGTYYNNDPEHTERVEESDQLKSTIEWITGLRFTGDKKASEMNKTIRQIEWRSFENR